MKGGGGGVNKATHNMNSFWPPIKELEPIIKHSPSPFNQKVRYFIKNKSILKCVFVLRFICYNNLKIYLKGVFTILFNP